MNKIIRFLLVLIGMIPVMFCIAQPPEMADTMRSNGKIYVVVAVCLIILIGLFLYVWGIDRKIRRMEKGG